MKFSGVTSSLLLLATSAKAIDVDWNDQNSIKDAMKTVANSMLTYYTGYRPGDIPGNLPSPYYWWEAGAMFGAMIDYWYYTGDTTWNDITTQAMLHQVGPDNDYMPPNQTKTEGNDDQGFWGMAAMSAAENKYPDPPSGQPGWLALAQAVFNTQVPRWDNSSCGGGLKWQIFTFNNGYNYKNTISQGCFFNIAARLGRYTGNQTYSDWANAAWDWVTNVGLMDGNYHFYDGTDDTINCSQINHIQWTYNAGVFLYGAATMWNISAEAGDETNVWRERTAGIISGLSVFLSPNIPNVLYEVACEPNGKCDVDQRSFKAYLSRWMASTMKVAPWTVDSLTPILTASRQAAAAQCNAGTNNTQCGLRWTTNGVNDGSFGVGEQMSALEVMGTALIHTVAGPVTNSTGGTSKGDPNAGTHSATSPTSSNLISTSDKAGAGILTALIIVGILGGAWWIIVDLSDETWSPPYVSL